MQIFCDSPVILVNHRLGYYLSVWKKFKTPNGVTVLPTDIAAYYRYSFPQYQYSPKKYGVTPDNIDEYVVISPDGETYPMYLCVPCGKCVLCRDKKKRDWSFRATCENVYSTSQPLFLTLTYNNAHLPKCGVFKEEFQLFMKRLRIKLDRKNIKHDIRYFAVGEYGSKSGRPHYHAIFWNFPTQSFNNITHVLHFIESCWRVPVLAPDGSLQYNDKGGVVSDSLGFALCKPCETGAISYVMKYMRKEAVLPKGANPVFFLSSRKNGGLGAQYARDNKDFYMKNPNCLTCTVTDPYSGKEFTQLMPTYFKRLYYPSNSVVVDKTVRDAFREFVQIITHRFEIERYMSKLTGHPYNPTITQQEKKIFKKFSFLKQPVYTKELYLPVLKSNYKKLYEAYQETMLKSTYFVRLLSMVTYDESYIVSRETLLKRREDSLARFFGNKRAQDLSEVKYRLINNIKLAQEKEIL